MRFALPLLAALSACAPSASSAPPESAKDTGLSDEWTWVEQVGAVLVPVRQCIRAHKEGRAAAIGVRTLATGELAIMTHSPDHTVACIYNGTRVVDRRPVELDPALVRKLPHVTVSGTPRLSQRDCWREQELMWAGRVVGWAQLPACQERTR